MKPRAGMRETARKREEKRAGGKERKESVRVKSGLVCGGSRGEGARAGAGAGASETKEVVRRD